MERNPSDKLQAFSSFAKGEKKLLNVNSSCVIYTRVSSKEQTKGMSLETQLKDCERYANRNKIRILGCFGGTYESAKTDERAEFNRMLSFVKKSRDKISIIIVYSVDRFSRSGANAIYIANQLKKEGIVVYAVTQPSDASTSSGTLQQNMQFIFSEYENQQRRDKCMAGIREKLLAGQWCTCVPIGYDIVRSEGKGKRIVLNAKGKLIKYAFELKSIGLTNEEVREQLAKKGLKLNNQRISVMLRNPFYCGLIVHKSLNGEIIEGKHQKAVSRDLFLKVNNILNVGRKQGISLKPENELTPLKRFLKCEKCGKYLTAYKAYKNQAFYYKCLTKGCCCNKRADVMHEEFKSMLETYKLNMDDEGLNYVISQQLIASYNQMTEGSDIERENLEKGIEEVSKKLDRLEERYVMEEITREMFEKYAEKIKKEREELMESFEKTGIRISNLKNCIYFAMILSSKLATVWSSSDYNWKIRLQFLLFPEGMYYNRQEDRYRTPKTNAVFDYIASLQRLWQDNKKRNSHNKMNVPCLVARSGIAPESAAADKSPKLSLLCLAMRLRTS